MNANHTTANLEIIEAFEIAGVEPELGYGGHVQGRVVGRDDDEFLVRITSEDEGHFEIYLTTNSGVILSSVKMAGLLANPGILASMILAIFEQVDA